MEATELKAAEELDQALGAVTSEVTIKGKPIQVRPLEAQQISDILRKVWALKERGAVSNEVEAVKAAAAPAETEGTEGKADLVEKVLGELKKINYVKLFMTGGDEVIDILRIGTYQRAEFVKTLNLVELITLAKKWVEVNVDFLLQNLPTILEMFGIAKEAEALFTEARGLVASTDSSTTAPE